MGELIVRRIPAAGGHWVAANLTIYEVKRFSDLNPLGWVYRLDRSDWVGLRWTDQHISDHLGTRGDVVAWLLGGSVS